MPVYRGAGGAGDATNDATVTAVQTAATSAATSATNAANSATAAANSASGASTSATNASNSATTAAGSVATASTQATNAATSASTAATQAGIATTQATNAASSASAASTSATNASNSATAASTSATNAGTYATNSAASAASTLAIFGDATDVANAVTAAQLAETNAETAETNAETAATTATNAASTATTQAAAALVSANNADADATAASIDANEAQAAATAAQSALNNSLSIYGSIAAVQNAASNSLANRDAAAASATSASNSASASATSATNSATSASAAATSAAAASAVALGNEPVRHSVRPSLLLDFANTKTLDPRITFTRASTGTYYDGKTTVKAEENLFTYSEQFDNAAWTKYQGSVTANSTTAPDGTTTADTLTASAGTVSPEIYRSDTSTALVPSTGSFYFKAGTHNFVQIWVTSQVAVYANFDLSAGTVGTSADCVASIQSVGSGWYRCSIVYTPASTAGRVAGVAMVGSSTATRIQTFSAAGTETIHVWGAQFEARSTLTAYTATTTAPITNYIPALQTAAAGVARFEHNPVTGESLGLEIEEQRTNLLTYSDDFSNAAWTKLAGSVTSNTIIAPDGTLTADKLAEDSTTAGHYIQSANATVSSGATVTATVYAKAGERTFIALYEGRANKGTYFNLSTGAVGGTLVSAPTSSSITSVGNGWYRCSITVTVPSTLSTVQVYLASADGTFNYAGNGWNGAYIWGAQLEAGAFATSYIPTVASQVTRSADSASMTGTNFSSWYRADEGTFYGEASPNALTSDSRYLHVGDATNRLLFWSGSSTFYVETRTSGIEQASLSFSGVTANTAFKFAGTYKVNDFAASRNATTVQTDTLGTVPVVSQMSIGSNNVGGNFLNGNIKKIAYYPARLTNAELVSLSTV